MAKKPTPPPPEEGLPGWFATFADMMTLLFAFFVLLAAISTIDPVKLQQMADSMGKSVGKKLEVDSQAMSLGDIYEALEEMVEEMEPSPETGEKPVEVKTSTKGVTLEVSSDISFGSGSAELKAAILPTLKKLVPFINRSYNMVAIEGHTDNEPLPEKFHDKFPSNWELSGARASAVVREFIRLGVDPVRLQSVGYAEFIPRDAPTDRIINRALILEFNASRALKAKNRRVGITFLATSIDRQTDWSESKEESGNE